MTPDKTFRPDLAAVEQPGSAKAIEAVYGEPVRLVIRYGWEYICGNSGPHFHVTGEVYPTQRRMRRGDFLAGGCIHSEILTVAPDFAPFIVMHLSDTETGAPMHAEANGLYFAAGWCGGLAERYHFGNSTPGHSESECLQVLADHVRLPAEQVEQDLAAWRQKSLERVAAAEEAGALDLRPADHLGDVRAQYREGFRNWIEEQRPRWKAEAEQCRDAMERRFVARGPSDLVGYYLAAKKTWEEKASG